MRKEFLKGAAKNDTKVVKAFVAANAENALKTKPKVSAQSCVSFSRIVVRISSTAPLANHTTDSRIASDDKYAVRSVSTEPREAK